MFDPNPKEEEFVRFSTILSRPSKAPPQINNIFEVFICTNSC